MLKEHLDDDLEFINTDNQTNYEKLLQRNEILEKRITVTEDELSIILINSFGLGGNSLSTLKKSRFESTSMSYIQVQDKSRILYPTIFLYEEVNDVTIANKATFIKVQIEKILGKGIVAINQSTFANLLGVKSATIKNYVEKDLIPNYYRDKKGRLMFKINEIVKWILLNSKMTMKYTNNELEKKINN